VLKRAVAIKTCLADDTIERARFVREAELAARLVHPNIVTIHDFGVDGETPYLVQELLPGEDLAQRLARGGEIPLAVKVRLLVEAATGLAHAHAAGVVHRDVKPGNLRVLPDGRLKILDFGIARELGAASMLTGDNRVVGTIAYMAPEQARGELADARADVHAWGAVAYELLSEGAPSPATRRPGCCFACSTPRLPHCARWRRRRRASSPRSSTAASSASRRSGRATAASCSRCSSPSRRRSCRRASWRRVHGAVASTARSDAGFRGQRRSS
jgi:serine/threonine protein kinase